MCVDEFHAPVNDRRPRTKIRLKKQLSAVSCPRMYRFYRNFGLYSWKLANFIARRMKLTAES
jgi:hypothetical protein